MDVNYLRKLLFFKQHLIKDFEISFDERNETCLVLAIRNVKYFVENENVN